MLLRKACPEGIDWDETLPDIHKDSWQIWTQYLNSLNGYQIPRMYAPTSLSLSKNHGVWERMIGITRRILDGILLQQNKKALTHEVLSTLMAEVSAVINSRPITTISSDPESPIILSPNILLT
jgi:hypothetical protein